MDSGVVVTTSVKLHRHKVKLVTVSKIIDFVSMKLRSELVKKLKVQTSYF